MQPIPQPTTTPRGSVAEEYPNLAAERDWARNDPRLAPDMVTAGSDGKICWLCSQSHSWHAVVKSRCLAGRGCPYCSNRGVLTGYDDLPTVDPLTAARWHPTLNYILTPAMAHEPIVVTVAYLLCATSNAVVVLVLALPISPLVAEAFGRICEASSHRPVQRVGSRLKARPALVAQ